MRLAMCSSVFECAADGIIAVEGAPVKQVVLLDSGDVVALQNGVYICTFVAGALLSGSEALMDVESDATLVCSTRAQGVTMPVEWFRRVMALDVEIHDTVLEGVESVAEGLGSCVPQLWSSPWGQETEEDRSRRVRRESRRLEREATRKRMIADKAAAAELRATEEAAAAELEGRISEQEAMEETARLKEEVASICITIRNCSLKHKLGIGRCLSSSLTLSSAVTCLAPHLTPI